MTDTEMDGATSVPAGRSEAAGEDLPDSTGEEAGERPASGRGSIRSAFAHHDYRIVWAGTFGSNIGTWMQNVLLGAYAYTLTHSATFVSLLYFAQMGPTLLLSNVGGVLADMVDRRKLLILLQAEQLVFSAVLAVVALTPNPSHVVLFLCVLAIGIGNSLGQPSMTAILPTLVPREDIAGAVVAQSVQVNLSRVIGPAIGAALYAAVGASVVFALNSITYLFAILSLVVVHVARAHVAPGHIWQRLVDGFRFARDDALTRRILVVMAFYAFLALNFVGLMPVTAAQNLGIAPKSGQYGLLYALFGVGGVLGATMVGTVFTRVPKASLIRPSLVAFAAMLTLFSFLRSPIPALVVAPLLGATYLMTSTSLLSVLQEHLDDAVRGRVLAIWIMCFGGTVPLGVLFGGWLGKATSITVVLMIGAVTSVLLACYFKPSLAWQHTRHDGLDADVRARRRSPGVSRRSV